MAQLKDIFAAYARKNGVDDARALLRKYASAEALERADAETREDRAEVLEAKIAGLADEIAETDEANPDHSPGVAKDAMDSHLRELSALRGREVDAYEAHKAVYRRAEPARIRDERGTILDADPDAPRQDRVRRPLCLADVPTENRAALEAEIVAATGGATLAQIETRQFGG